MSKFKVAILALWLLSVAAPTAAQPMRVQDDSMPNGMYLGILGFNDLNGPNLQKFYKPISLLSPENAPEYVNLVNSFTTDDATNLYYAVDVAIDKLAETPLPANPKTVALVTFTDGIDEGSTAWKPQYTESTYLSYIKNRIRNENINGTSITSYAIGLYGQNLNQAKFRENLQSIASSNSNYYEINAISELSDKLRNIAKGLKTVTVSQNLTLKVTVGNGILYRFTFDGVSSPNNSSRYIEGTVKPTSSGGWVFTDIKYVGLKSTSGTTITIPNSDSSIRSFKVENIQTLDGAEKAIVAGKVNRFFTNDGYFTSNNFNSTNEYQLSEEDLEEKIEYGSAVVMLVLDCSSSLNVTDQNTGKTYFTIMKESANEFIQDLANNTNNAPDEKDIISFEDSEVERLCIANWDTNGSGKLSKAEAEAVTDLGNVFYNSSIQTFDELKYFTGLETIGNSAFSGCTSLTAITIPNSVTTIGDYAFDFCTSLTAITIPNSVTSIGDYAFYVCAKLTAVTIPNSVTTIGIHAYGLCESITAITIPNSVTTIGRSAFALCTNLTEITIPNSVTSIGDHPIMGCSALASIIVESGNAIYDSRNNCNAIIRKSDNTLIAGCKNTTIPNSVINIDGHVFERCTSLTAITIPNSVASIGEGAFNMCTSLTAITIPNSVTSIGGIAFWGCTSLTEITIPNSVTTIGDYAFYDCTNLTSVTVESRTPLTISSNTFAPENQNATLYVPKGCRDAYLQAPVWQDFKEIVEMEMSNGITTTTNRQTYDVYTLTGMPVRKKAETLEGLAKGVYIINGRKSIVR